ncbi:cbb3-type cytochrome oxidase assembly protein CcoS [Sinorhizobium sp. BG8]|uniref:cbb3-type cytochrome oxidase assembly protein CcoS n=1 Tax=Sinorhizobium sp. BG8 TaxID=2613773 RepID=UPI00193DF884|nr:cbb3-type cytochrome oxidase assembly protein CcoS [Sinorhizobium sp. BG8]QRM55764.1 cbb3-type cytochrome oxidase assembly protein CcoS [Sinorhizobium sp. BG8]
MNTLVFLIPIALFLGGLGLAAFLWALRSGQYEDIEGAAWRVLEDDDGVTQQGAPKTADRPNNHLS